MAINWSYNADDYKEQDFSILPEGDYKLRVAEVVEKTFKSGNQGFEITFDISGKNSKLWYYLVLMPDNVAMTNQKLGAFFKSFGITDTDLNHSAAWVGKIGACRTRIRKSEQYGDKAEIHYFLNPEDKRVKALGDWVESGNSAMASEGFQPVDNDVPF